MGKAFIAVCFCLASIVWAQPKSGDDRTAKEQPAKDQRGTKQQPLVIEGIPTAKPDAETREEREYRTQQTTIAAVIGKSLQGIEKESERASLLTLGLVVVAIVQAGLFVWQLLDLKSATRIAAATSRAARRSALASERALKTSMTIEGAALVVDVTEAGLIVQPPGAPGVRPFVNYGIRNFGRSAATIIRFQDRLRWAAALQIPADFDGEALEARPERNVILIPERNVVPIGCVLPHNIQEPEWNNPGDLRLHLVSRVEYRDVFGRVFVEGFAVRVTRGQGLTITVETAGGDAYNYRTERTSSLPDGSSRRVSAIRNVIPAPPRTCRPPALRVRSRGA